MKIGIDGRLWNESGVGRYIRNLVFELSKIDTKNHYILFVRDVNEVRPRKLPGNWQLKKVNVRWHTIEEQLKFSSILKKENLDLVHFPYFSVPIFYNRPFVVTIHDLILHHFPTGEASTLPLPLYKLKLTGYKFVISSAAKRAKKIITVSEATKEEIIKHLRVKPGKVIVTYEGVDDQISKLILRQAQDDAEQGRSIKTQISELQLKSKNFFLYVGNAYPHKNLDRLVETFRRLCHPERSEGSRFFGHRPQNDIRLVLVGKEDYFYKRLKEKVNEMGLTNNVVFFGEARDEELTTLYRNAKALILPSLMEGFGLPAVEAMASKCLVLASDIPAVRETCQEAAIYFNPYDVNDIRAKMEAVCLNDLSHFNKNIEDGLKRVKIFSWQKMAEETLKVYQSL